MATSKRTETLTEFADSAGVALTAEDGIIRGVKIVGFESANGRSYPPGTLKAAASLYEGAKVNVNHSKQAGPREYQARLGALANVRFVEGSGLHADLKYNPKHPLAEQLVWDAANAPGNVGMSHVVEANVSRKTGKDIVESITRVRSVDLVADPATNRSLFEHDEEDDVKLADITLEQLRAERPELIAECLEAADSDKELVSLRAQVKALSQQVESFKLAESKLLAEKEIADLLAESKLPAEAITDAFKKSLTLAEDRDAREALVADRKALWEAASQHKASGVKAAEKPPLAAHSARKIRSAKELAEALS